MPRSGDAERWNGRGLLIRQTMGDILHRAAVAAGGTLGRVLHRPRWVELETARACNLRCTHCDAWRMGKVSQPLGDDDWFRILRELRECAGRCRVTFTTGEPLIDATVLDKVEAAERLGLYTYLTTNGTLIDRSMADRIRASRLRLLGLSLDGVRAGTHDAGRGVPGTHAKVMEALRLLRDQGSLGLRLRLMTVIAAHNLDELGPLARLAEEQGLEGILFLPLQHSGGSWRKFWPRDSSRVRLALDELARMRRQGAPILNTREHLGLMSLYYEDPGRAYPRLLCRSGSKLIVLNDGKARLCRYGEVVGDLHRNSVREVWESGRVRRAIREIAACKKPCILNPCHFRRPIPDRIAQLLRRW